MADQPLIPPVTNNTPLLKKHSSQVKSDKKKSGRKKPLNKKRNGRDDGLPHIDEFA